MGNTQPIHAGSDGKGGGAFSCIGSGSEKKNVKKGMRPRLAFEKIDKNANANSSSGGGLCAAPRDTCVGIVGKNDEQVEKRATLTQEQWALKKEELKRRMRSNLRDGRTKKADSFTPNKSVNNNVYFDEPCQCKGICVCRYKKAAMLTNDAKSAQSSFDERIKKLKNQIAKEKYREKMENARRAGAGTRSSTGKSYVDV